MGNFGGIATFGSLTGSNLKPIQAYGDNDRRGGNDRKRSYNNNNQNQNFGNIGIKNFNQLTGGSRSDNRGSDHRRSDNRNQDRYAKVEKFEYFNFFYF